MEDWSQRDAKTGEGVRNTTEKMIELENFITNLKCPKITGITFPDGRLKLLNLKIDWKNSPVTYEVSYGGETNVREKQRTGELEWNYCFPLVKLDGINNGISVLGGECDYGSDGFLALIDTNNDKLIWVAFFFYSNPFYKVSIDDNFVYAKSTMDSLWKFPIQNPTGVEVEPLKYGHWL